jgi:hypothetical protein
LLAPPTHSAVSSLLILSTTGATTYHLRVHITRSSQSSRAGHSPSLLPFPLPTPTLTPTPTSPPAQLGYTNRDNANTATSSCMSALQTSASTPMPPGHVWPPPLLPSTARNAAQREAHAPLNLGADEDEQVWTGESVGLGFGLLTKGKVSIDAINWDCKIWSVRLPHRADHLCV